GATSVHCVDQSLEIFNTEICICGSILLTTMKIPLSLLQGLINTSESIEWNGYFLCYRVEWCVLLKGFSPVWTLWCLFRSPAWAKRMLHWVQLKGFTPVWTIWCLFRLEEWEKLGFTPVWTLWCLFRLEEWENLARHRWQPNGFSPVCILWWISTCLGKLKTFPQNEHGNRLSFPPEQLIALLLL
uniref:Uncharacterized protein n=1 Tax=Hucho hucho TaxID=62062 RepID=A0A4W5K5S8_9TELE